MVKLCRNLSGTFLTHDDAGDHASDMRLLRHVFAS